MSPLLLWLHRHQRHHGRRLRVRQARGAARAAAGSASGRCGSCACSAACSARGSCSSGCATRRSTSRSGSSSPRRRCCGSSSSSRWSPAEAPMDPRQDDVGAVPIGRLDGRGDRRRAAVVVGAIALVVVIGLASAQLRPEVTPPVAIVPTETSAPTTDAPPTPSASLEVTPPRLRAAELVEAVRSGSLEHTLVYADATLDVDCGEERMPCAEPRLAVEGLALDVLPDTLGTPDRHPAAALRAGARGPGRRARVPGRAHRPVQRDPALRGARRGERRAPARSVRADRRRGLAVLDGPCLGPRERTLPCAAAGDARRRRSRPPRTAPRGRRTVGRGPGRRLGHR